MPGQAAKLTITECQDEFLQALSRANTAPSRLRQRASIIIDGLRNQEITEAVGMVHPPGRTLATTLGQRLGATY